MAVNSVGCKPYVEASERNENEVFDFRTSAIKGRSPYVYTGAQAALNSAANSSVYASRPSFTGDEFVLNNTGVKTSSPKELKAQLDETRKKQGIIGKAWDGLKNLTGLGAGSNKAEKAIEKFEKGEISEEEALKAVEKYQAGQKQAVDFVADMATGIISVAGVALAIPTGGASLAVTIPTAMAIGAVAKPAIKGLDALSGGREYSLKEGLKDAAMGAVNGGLGILTAGVGKAVTSGAKNIVMSAVKEGALSTGKKAAIRVGAAAVGGSASGAIYGGVSSGAGYLTDGGSLDEGFANAVKTGAIGGAIFGGLTGAATEGVVVAKEAVKNNINAKATSKNVLPNGNKTTFQQGAAGDCHVLSTVDGMLNNPKTAKLIRKSITTMPDGNYQVKMGNEMVIVAKNAIPEGLLSDVQGVRIFEQAYKQMNGGNLDGGFADVVAKQFGLKPVHITQADLTDDVIKKIAQGQDNLVLSAGIETGGQRHYLSVRNIDVEKGMVTLVDPKDTSKIIQKSLTDFKKEIISLDGGSIKKVDLPNSVRPEGEVGFYGKTKVNDAYSNVKITEGIIKGYSDEQIIARLKTSGISVEDFNKAAKMYGKQAASDYIEGLSILRESPLFRGSNPTLEDAVSIMQKLHESRVSGKIDSLDLLTSYERSLGEDRMLEIAVGRDVTLNRAEELISQLKVKAGGFNANDMIEIFVNGEKKYIHCKDQFIKSAGNLPPKNYDVLVDNLTKSNMITRELIDTHALLQETGGSGAQEILRKIEGLQVDIYGNRVMTPFKDLLERARTNFTDLNSHEIHTITDVFYKKVCVLDDKVFGSALREMLSSNGSLDPKFAKIAGIVNAIKGRAAKKGIELNDHAIMRLLDRGLLNPVDVNGNVVSFDDFLVNYLSKNKGLIQSNIGKGTPIPGLYSPTGTPVIVIPGAPRNGLIAIDTFAA